MNLSKTIKRLCLEGKIELPSRKGCTPWNKGLKLGKNPQHSLRMIGCIPWNKGLTKNNDGRLRVISERMKRRKMSQETRIKISESGKGRKLTPKQKEIAIKNFDPYYWKGRHNPNVSGKNNWNWKGGRTSETRRLRTSLEYREWREKVFKRDYWTCRFCGKKGHELHAHHIKSWSKFPELRFDVNNGKTSCVPCHEKTESYPKQLAENWNKQINSLEENSKGSRRYV